MRSIFSRDARHTLIACSICSMLGACGASSDRELDEAFRAGASDPLSGSLDPSFGKGGTVTSDVSPMGAGNLALQSDGKIVVVTTLGDPTGTAAQVFGVVRFLANGAPDPTFGGGGVVRTACTAGFNAPTSVAISPEGKIVVVGSASAIDNSSAAVAVVRYLPRGALDASFGNGGLVTTTLLGKRDVANVVLLTSDGKILVGGGALTEFGVRGINDTALIRYGADGQLDPTFGQGGKVLSNSIGSVMSMALATDGSIVALGVDRAGQSAVTRFGSNGSAQTSQLVGTVGASATTGKATLQTDGASVVGSSVRGKSRYDVDVRVDRYTSLGTVDTTFASPIFDFASPGVANRPNAPQALLVQPNGMILVGGLAAVDLGVSAFGLARFRPDGAFDTTFGSSGIVTTPFFGKNDQIFALARQPDGKIIAVGSTIDPSTNTTRIALARYLGD
jgi:uncharacterized delta-60 repeat protein